MAKKKQPAPKKGGKKKGAPKEAKKRNVLKARRNGVTTAALGRTDDRSGYKGLVGSVGEGFPIERLCEDTGTAPLHPTVEEQFEAEARALPKTPAPKKRFRFRDAITGLFVKLGWAKAHPDTTVRERVD